MKKIIIIIVSLIVVSYILNYIFLIKNKKLLREDEFKNIEKIELKISERDSVINRLMYENNKKNF